MKPIVPFRSKKRENFVVLYEVLRSSTYKSTYPFQTVKQRASHGLTVDEALEMANFIKEKNLFFQMVLDGITGCT